MLSEERLKEIVAFVDGVARHLQPPTNCGCIVCERDEMARELLAKNAHVTRLEQEHQNAIKEARLAETRVKEIEAENARLRLSGQVIWFHGTDEKTAEIIQREGFKEGTYFAAHMEDAVHYGGNVVFHVRVVWDSPSLDGGKSAPPTTSLRHR